MHRPGLEVEVLVEGDDVALPSQAATSLALVVNELVQNALEHAFVGRSQGQVRVSLRAGPETLTIDVRDNGVGLSSHPSRQLGLEIVETLVQEDLKGEWSLVGDGGTLARITVPLESTG
jgi:two-component system, sensor histidine kinase PdtaS